LIIYISPSSRLLVNLDSIKVADLLADAAADAEILINHMEQFAFAANG